MSDRKNAQKMIDPSKDADVIFEVSAAVGGVVVEYFTCEHCGLAQHTAHLFAPTLACKKCAKMTPSRFPSKPIADCSTDEIIEHLGNRLPAFALGACIPTTGGTSDTVTYFGGNRATCLGLANLAHTTARARLINEAEVVDLQKGESRGEQESTEEELNNDDET